MNMKIELVPRERSQVIRHLMQFYLYDFTKYLNIDVDSNGIFRNIPVWRHSGQKRTASFLF